MTKKAGAKKAVAEAPAPAAAPPPRVACDCYATRHAALTNCLSCGKVVCEAEGYGPCSFCGAPVAPPPSKSAAAAPATAGEPSDAERRAAKAMQLKESLILYDRTSAQRTVVYDDQEDYYNSSEWLSPEERQRKELEQQARELESRKREEEARRSRIVFDFAGRRVYMASGAEQPQQLQQQQQQPEAQRAAQGSSTAQAASAPLPPAAVAAAADLSPAVTPNPSIKQRKRPVYRPAKPLPGAAKPSASAAASAARPHRVQNDYFSTEPDVAFAAEEGSSAARAGAGEGGLLRPSFPVCGIAEGALYDRSWDAQDRAALFSLMRKRHATHYLYAPKSSPSAAQMEAIVQQCSSLGVALNYGVHAAGVNTEKAPEVNALAARFLQAQRLGVTHFTVLFHGADPAMWGGNVKHAARSHASACNAVATALSADGATPSLYVCGAAPAGVYCSKLAGALDPRYTLLLVGAPLRAVPEARSCCGKRRLVFVDRFPAVDFASSPVPFIRPHPQVESDPLELLDGILFTPMQWARSSVPALDTAFEWAASAKTYGEAAALTASLRRSVGDDVLAEDLAELAAVAPCSEVAIPDAGVRSQVLESRLRTEAARDEARRRVSRVRSLAQPELVQELTPFLEMILSLVSGPHS
eukprot:m51a1_g7002 hypothetical protein (641) ;mRNA; r:208984-211345